MREVQATKPRRAWSRFLRAVEHGETIAITRHGKAVAHLVPVVGGPRQPGKGGRALPAAPRRVEACAFSTEEILDARHHETPCRWPNGVDVSLRRGQGVLGRLEGLARPDRRGIRSPIRLRLGKSTWTVFLRRPLSGVAQEGEHRARNVGRGARMGCRC